MAACRVLLVCIRITCGRLLSFRRWLPVVRHPYKKIGQRNNSGRDVDCDKGLPEDDLHHPPSRTKPGPVILTQLV